MAREHFGAVILALATASGIDTALAQSAAPNPPPEVCLEGVCVPTVPAVASQVGYRTLTFGSGFTSKTVDTGNTKGTGFNWYHWDLFGAKATNSAYVLNSDGSITLQGIGGMSGGQIVSATVKDSGYVGTVFRNGAYIESEMSWDKASVDASSADMWPAFWSLPLEGNLTGSAQWQGQVAGYNHFIELDFFEAFHKAPMNQYGATIHDWFGIQNVTCSGYCAEHVQPNGDRNVPAGTNFGQYHKYGFLWVPATATAKGYAKFFFDGVQIGGTVTWDRYTNQAPTPIGQPWAFSFLDTRSMFLILGTGPNQPLKVRSVNVWQTSAAANQVP